MKCVDLKLETAVEVVGFVGTPAGPVVGVCVHPVTGALYSREIAELVDLAMIPKPVDPKPPVIVDSDTKEVKPVYPNTRVDARTRASIDEAVHEGLTKGDKNANHRRR